MSRRPDLTIRWYENRFDPYQENREKKAAQLALWRKRDPKSLGFAMSDPDMKRQIIVKGVQSNRAKHHPVSLPKVWK